MRAPNFKDAYQQIDRALEHVTEIKNILSTEKPFSYVLETNLLACRRSTRAKRNEPIIDRIKMLSGDAVHCLHQALDYGYWEIVSPFATSPGKEKNVQFPFSREESQLTTAAKNRLAHLVGSRFLDTIVGFKTHSEPSGNKLLYLINQIDSANKHRSLVPVGNYNKFSGDLFRRLVPDCPFIFSQAEFGNCARDISWSFRPLHIINYGAPNGAVLEKELDIPIDVVFVVENPNYSGPVIKTLDTMIDITKTALTSMKSAV